MTSAPEAENMGIRGLNKFFDMNPDLSQPYRLHNTTVVIDGGNLLNYLYFNNKVPCTYGGDYDSYASVVKNYFSKFGQCKIKPVVILDGGLDKTDRKLETIIQRTNGRIELVDRLAKQESYSEDVLPIFAYSVFTDVIKEMNITHAQCSFEADGPICFIANHYQSPVISLDSDFYIFDLDFGFIRTDHIDLTVRTSRDKKGNKYHFMNCKIYYIDNFISFFPGLQKSLLPLFSTVLGNDFIEASTFDRFFYAELPRVKSKKLKVSERHQRMIGLLEWLKPYHNVDTAINDLVRYVTEKKRTPVKNLMKQAVDSYRVSESNLLNYLDPKPQSSDSYASNPEEILTTFEGNLLPSWFVDRFHRADISCYALNIVGLRKVFLPIQVQDTALPSPHRCSLTIRQVLYGLLISLDNLSDHNKSKIYVEEYDRVGSELQKHQVRPIMTLDGYGLLPRLSSKTQLSVKNARLLISCALGEHKTYVHDLPDFWQLLAMCIRFWLRTCCSPEPCVDLLDALLLTVLYVTVVEPRVPEHVKAVDRRSAHCVKLSPKTYEKASILDIIGSVSPSNATYCWEKFKKYFQLPWHDHNNPVVMAVVHSYSQLQVCICHAMLLNEVIGKPFLTPKIQCTFNGTLIYNLTGALQSSSSETFLSETLGPCSALDYLFKKLKNKILEDLPQIVCKDHWA